MQNEPPHRRNNKKNTNNNDGTAPIHDQLIPRVKYTYTIHKSVDRCPMLVDIYFACLQHTAKGTRQTGCKYHHDALQSCLMTELKLDIDQLLTHECHSTYKQYNNHKKQKEVTERKNSSRAASSQTVRTEDDEDVAIEPLAQCIRSHLQHRQAL